MTDPDVSTGNDTPYEPSNDDLADLALGDTDGDLDEEGEEAAPEEESFWGNFKAHVPQAKELADLKASLSAKEQELAAALASRKLQLEDLFDESVIKGLPADEIEELAAALYFTIHPEKVDKEIANGIKAKRDAIAARRQKDKEDAEIRSKVEAAARAKEEADIRVYQVDLREAIVDMSDSLPSLLKLAGGSRAELAKLVFEEVTEAVEAGIAKSAEDIDPAKVLAGLERRAAKVVGRSKPVAAPAKKSALVKGNPRTKLRGIFAK